MPVSINGSTGITGAINIQAAGSVLTGVTTITDNSTTGLVISGIATVSAGSTSAPSIAPSGDTNTGLFFPSADTIAFTSGGTERGRWISGGGLTFNGDTAAANALDDYEEGTWTPVPNGVTVVSGSPTYVGTYTRIGRTVHVSMIQTAGTITVAAGNYFSGLPFTPINYHNTGSWSCAATGKSGVSNVFTNGAIYIQQVISTGTSLVNFATSAMYIV